MLSIVMAGLVACDTSPKPVVQVPLTVITDLQDSLKQLRSYQKELQIKRDSGLSAFHLRSVRDVEFHEFVSDHPMLNQDFPNGRCGILADSALLYSGISANDSVIAVLTFKTTFIIEAIEENKAKVKLYTRALSGYVDLKDIYTYKTTLSPGFIEVMMGQTSFAPEQKPMLRVVLSKYRTGGKLGVFELGLERNDFKVIGIGSALLNGRTIFGLVQSFGDKETVDYYHCDGSGFNKILEKENRRLKDGYEYSSVYFPTKYQNGEVRHTLSGPFEGAFNMATGKMNIVEVPDHIGLVPESVVVVRTQTGSMIEGDPRYEPFEAENEMLLIESTKTDYYLWDGKALTLHTSTTSKEQGDD